MDMVGDRLEVVKVLSEDLEVVMADTVEDQSEVVTVGMAVDLLEAVKVPLEISEVVMVDTVEVR